MSIEVLDYFDEAGNLLGQLPRPEVHRLGFWHKTVQVWLLNEKRELLLQLRSPQKACFPGLWDISCAGHIASGVSVSDAALCELSEELGIICKKQDLTFLFESQQAFPDISSGLVDREMATVFLLQIKSSEPLSLQPSEVDAVRWIHYTKLLEDFYQNRSLFVPHELHFKKLVACLNNLL